MPSTCDGTERPCAPLLQLDIVLRDILCRIGGRLGSLDASSGGVALEIPPWIFCGTNRCSYPALGQCLAGSLTGAVTSQRVTEVYKGSLMLDGNQQQSAKAQGSLTARPTGRAGGKPGLSDPVVPRGRAIAQRIKGTPGITG